MCVAVKKLKYYLSKQEPIKVYEIACMAFLMPMGRMGLPLCMYVCKPVLKRNAKTD